MRAAPFLAHRMSWGRQGGLELVPGLSRIWKNPTVTKSLPPTAMELGRPGGGLRGDEQEWAELLPCLVHLARSTWKGSITIIVTQPGGSFRVLHRVPS